MYIHTFILLAGGLLWQLAVVFSSRLASQTSQFELKNKPNRACLLARLGNEPSQADSIASLSGGGGGSGSARQEHVHESPTPEAP